MHLTKRLIDKATYAGKLPTGWDVRWDDEVPGFGVRIYPTGEKAFILRYRFNGRKRFLTIGQYGILTLDQARSMARSNLVEVLQGKDPIETKKTKTQGEKVSDLCTIYMERHAKVHKKTWDTDQSRINRHILPAWRNFPIASIKRSDIVLMHTKIGNQNGPYEANRVVELLSKMFELATRWGFLPEGSTNPARGIDIFKEKKRDRWVRPDELPRLAAAIAQEQNLYARAAIWLYLLTGVRKSELLKAKWQDVDFSRLELRLPDTKSGRTHYIPLSKPVIKILSNLPRIEGNPYILSGTVEGRHLVNISKPWRRIRKMAQLEDVRLHDLRRTVGSWLACAGNSLLLIGRVLNHSNPSTTAIYARLAEDHVRKALEDHGERILETVGGNPMSHTPAK